MPRINIVNGLYRVIAEGYQQNHDGTETDINLELNRGEFSET